MRTDHHGEGHAICIAEGLARGFEACAAHALHPPVVLAGPANWRAASGEQVEKSRFYRVPDRGVWQWVAFNPSGQVISLIEMPFTLRYVCETEQGALWALRGIVAHYMRPDCRAYRD